MLARMRRLARRGVDTAAMIVERVRVSRNNPPRRVRLERFGGIFQLTIPRALVFVDRAMARDTMALANEPAIWDGPEPALGEHVLSAPLEAHLQLTNRCAAGCTGCYTGASPDGAPNEWGLVEWTRALDALAEAGVFHVALGGGESAILPWLGVVWWGAAATDWLLAHRPSLLAGPLPRAARPLAVLGRWSLSFYMLHQPVLIGVLWLVATIGR